VDDSMHILLNLEHRERGVGSARLKRLQGLHFQVFPLELLAVPVPHQHFADQHPLLVVHSTRGVSLWLSLPPRRVSLSRRLVGPSQRQRSRTEKRRFRYQQPLLLLLPVSTSRARFLSSKRLCLSRLVRPNQRQRRRTKKRRFSRLKMTQLNGPIPEMRESRAKSLEIRASLGRVDELSKRVSSLHHLRN
jgi:hypothetical protein